MGARADAGDGVRLVPLGEVARAHGVRGELRVKLYNSESDLLLDQRSAWLRRPSGEESMVRIHSSRRVDGAVLLKLVGVDDRDAAQALQKALVCLPRDALEKTEDGEFYLCDIVGAEVVGPAGALGLVEEVVSYPTSDVLVVRHAQGSPERFEIPLLEHFVESVDVVARRVVVSAEALDLLL